MELKLSIYNRKQIEKTYTAETYDLMFGTVEDLIEVINLDKLQTGSDAELVRLAGDVVVHSLDIIKPLLKDIFEGLTDEELKHTKVKEIASVLVNVVKFSIEEVGKGAKRKN
ncbi:MAG: hypothetical protein K2I00_02120 [Ruminococcus sp.]|nr:hypothetical protein [Ruminococcus sp.]